MTLVKFNHQPARTFSSLVDDIFNGKFINRDFATSDFFGQHAPVNIHENKESYVLDVVAPGFDKGDFKINLDGQTLTLSAEKKTEQTAEGDKQIRREFSFRSFSRSFTVDENIDADKINAKYENGVLKVTLPKKEAKQETVKEITVA
ncbi:Hsp20/alpha crystallin family protein [Chitinophaga lutea]|uniref:Hsp20/alpha crystallin family protein n=1 Tax=Chitinophaga lutea TaxID=2488634 RepID=A0A3N4PNA4_9BACT|nr:Hsp20/alpha crystallin family protein [Chitinophaga lutea]RPE09078.1 Hsp20/alpha crystallin family protein [Chitinophaga lutea]